MVESTVNSSKSSKPVPRTTKAAKPAKPRSGKSANGSVKDGPAKRSAPAGNARSTAKGAVAAGKGKQNAKGGSAKAGVLTAEERRTMIAERAYLRAERRGFQGGSSEEDWLAAEAEVDRMIAGSKHASL